MQMRKLVFTVLIAMGLSLGCRTQREDVGTALVYAPLAIPALPVYGLAQGWQALRDTGADRIYPPVGLTPSQVQEQVDKLPGKKPRKEVFLDPGRHVERWIVRKGRAIV